MIPDVADVRAWLGLALTDAAEQGHATDGLADELAGLDSLDALASFASRVADLPLREDWPYVEPDDLDEIRAEGGDPPSWTLRPDERAARAEAAFGARVAGCMLGKPFEFDPTLDELRAALEPLGEWPLRDYMPEAAVPRLREVQGQMPELVRERIDHVAPDDDLNYTIVGMLLLEAHGEGWTRDDLLTQWHYQLPVRATFGPERTILIRSAIATLTPDPSWRQDWTRALNPGAELCGALIRVDAYAYACLGEPARAAAMAWRDASTTHRRTGVYAAMFVAAAQAAMPCTDDPLDAFEVALACVPARSRFAERARAALGDVRAARDWEDGYRRAHERFPGYTHCRVYQEIGTLMNTMRFARDPGEGICLQVMQGNDTDSFGATAGSMLGLRHGPIAERWLAPFRDDLRMALATFHERSLAAVTRRMGAVARAAGAPIGG